MRERKTKKTTANSNTCYYTIFKTFAGKMVYAFSTDELQFEHQIWCLYKGILSTKNLSSNMN